ncbi:hypothetical protein BGZ58_002715, partial [Dissophora ornata]
DYIPRRYESSQMSCTGLHTRCGCANREYYGSGPLVITQGLREALSPLECHRLQNRKCHTGMPL